MRGQSHPCIQCLAFTPHITHLGRTFLPYCYSCVVSWTETMLFLAVLDKASCHLHFSQSDLCVCLQLGFIDFSHFFLSYIYIFITFSLHDLQTATNTLSTALDYLCTELDLIYSGLRGDDMWFILLHTCFTGGDSECGKNTSLETERSGYVITLWNAKNTCDSLENIKTGGEWERRLKYGRNLGKMGGLTAMVILLG